MDVRSMMSGGAAAVAESLLRRSLLLAARDTADVQGLTDCAGLALATGDRDSARMLYELTFLHGGFSPGALRRQQRIARQTGLWPDERLPPPAPAAPLRFSVDLALAELAGLLRVAQALPALADDGEELIAPASPPNLETTSPASLEQTARAACGRLCRALRGDAGHELEDLLTELRATILLAPLVDLRDHVGEDASHLATLLAFRSLQDFLRVNHDLGSAPLGSAALLHAAARLDPAALGSYFVNLRNILRAPRDLPAIITLAGAADGAAAISDEVRDRWLILLSTHLDRHMLLDLIDELADDDVMRPLWGILAGAARRAQASDEREILWRIRDAGLDCNAMALAIRAQELIAELFVNHAMEWRVLGDMRGTIGDIAGARAAFAECLLFAPDDKGVRERLEALAKGDFIEFEIFGGFGTPLLRRQRRIARWATPASGPPADPVAA